MDKYGVHRVSVERVVSGQGIVAIYQFFRDCFGTSHAQQPADESTVGQIVRTWEKQVGKSEKTGRSRRRDRHGSLRKARLPIRKNPCSSLWLPMVRKLGIWH